MAKALFFEPMLCETAEQPPEGAEWRYELKLDGYRAIGFKTDGQARLWSRNGKDFVRRFPEVAKAIASLPEATAIDGEIVALDADGKPSFALLQGSGTAATPVVFYVFDLLMLRGKDSRLSPLEQRRKRLRKIVDGLPEIIRYSETFAVPAETLIRVVRENGLEGIVAKRAGSTYRSGRSGDWVKWRANRGQEFVIGGYIPASSAFDSFLIGYYEGRYLIYAGRVRAGLVAESRRALLAHFAELRIERCPFRNLPERTKGRWGEGLTAEDMEKCRWLAPRLVAAVEFLEWTPELRLRHPRFVGLRTDKDPNEVVRE
jgi:bifunctional non-homologous end joining protein LigD